VDDDAIVLINTVAMLEELGHCALSASSGRHALEILRGEQRVDLVITDRAMPQMTGLQLAQAIKDEWPDLPVVIAAGYGELDHKLGQGLPKLAKPFGERELQEAIRRACCSRDHQFAGSYYHHRGIG
jgi:CheY-like chemotaxis protein